MKIKTINITYGCGNDANYDDNEGFPIKNQNICKGQCDKINTIRIELAYHNQISFSFREESCI